MDNDNLNREEIELAAKVFLLEELIEFNIKEAREAEHTAYIAGAHYTYLDKMRGHRQAVTDLERFHMGLLKYPESSKRLRAIRNRIELEMNKKYSENAPMEKVNNG